MSKRKRCVFSKKGMFTRLSVNFGNLELPNQSRHGCGGAGLARTVIDGVYFRRRILASNSEEKDKKKKGKGVQKDECQRTEKIAENRTWLSRRFTFVEDEKRGKAERL